MKTILLLLFSVSTIAQQGINYKALIKDGSGNIVANQNITVQFIIYKGASLTNNVYQETHSPTTDANGIIIINIGGGTTSDDFTTIDWASDEHHLNVQVDTAGGTTFTDMGTTQFMTVPYALTAANAASKIDELSDGKADANGSSLFIGIDAGLADDGTDNLNVGIGFNALYSNTSGFYNTANGNSALFTNTEGAYNTANGTRSLYFNETGNNNTASGAFSLFRSTIGIRNTASGHFAMYANREGNQNTALGSNALPANVLGSNNTAIGYRAGNLSVGDNNVFIGHLSGGNETGSNKLYIENSLADADNALIYGEFGADNTSTDNILRTNSEFQIGNPTETGYAFPTVDGSSNQVLQTDGSGVLSWQNSITPSGLGVLDEGNGIGRALIGRNPNNYGNIGLDAVDLSYTTFSSTTHGATGFISTALGSGTIASGIASTAMGDGTTASGFVSTAMGENTTALSDFSTAMGVNTTSSGEASTAMGAGTTATGNYSTTMGESTTASAYVTALGRFNVGGGSNFSWTATDPLFEVGNGTSTVSSNALTILKNGTITAPSFDLAEITNAKALITKEYGDANFLSSGLEALDEGNGIGWRLVGQDPNNYGNIGLAAIDLSYFTVSSTTKGATGEYSTAMGRATTASGARSTAMGSNTTASEYSTTAMGSNTNASGTYSTAMGSNTNASGTYSTVMGFNTTATYNATSLGRYNVGGGSITSWIATQPLFEVGNGTSTVSSNALTILKNGTITAPSFDLAEITDSKALITKEYADLNLSANSLNDLTDARSDNDGSNNGSSIFLGINTGYNDDKTDNQNVGIGYSALYTNSSGNQNIAVGRLTLYTNSSGSNNTAIGGASLLDNTTGSFNTATGITSLANNTTGKWNTATGYQALTGNTTGDNNIAIGYNAQVGTGLSNQIQIGNNTIANAYVHVAWALSSDRRWKKEIRELPYGLDFLKQLKPVDYVRKSNDSNTREIGFIAQDIEALLLKVGYDDQGIITKNDDGYMSVRYNDFIAILTKAMQEQQDIIESQQDEINSLQSLVGSQQAEVKTLTSELATSQEAQNSFNDRLLQIEELLNTVQQ